MSRETRTGSPLRTRAAPALTVLASSLMTLAAAPVIRAQEQQLEAPRIIVGSDHDYAPYEALGQDGEPTRNNVELTRAIAALAPSAAF